MAERRRRGRRLVWWLLGAGTVAGIAWLVAQGDDPNATFGERLEDARRRLTEAFEAGWDAMRDEMRRAQAEDRHG